MGGPRPRRPRRRRRRPAAAGDRTGVRQRPEVRQPRDLDAVADPAISVGWSPAAADLTRTAPARATDAHISVIGHITAAELRHHLTSLELANGFANRFLLLGCRRQPLLPEGGNPDPLNGTGLTACSPPRSDTPAPPDASALEPAAREPWRHAYTQLAQPSRRDRRRDLRPRRGAHDPPRAPLRARRRRTADQDRAPASRARALGLHRPLRQPGRSRDATGDPLAEQIHAALTRSPAG